MFTLNYSVAFELKFITSKKSCKVNYLDAVYAIQITTSLMKAQQCQYRKWESFFKKSVASFQVLAPLLLHSLKIVSQGVKQVTPLSDTLCLKHATEKLAGYPGITANHSHS
jgi:hypothetical protein